MVSVSKRLLRAYQGFFGYQIGAIANQTDLERLEWTAVRKR